MMYLDDTNVALDLLVRAAKSELTVEVVMSALNHMKNDPTLKEIDAIAIAVKDWDC